MQTFCQYMEEMLYGPAGYYSSGTAKSGKGGDYFTSPDVGPAFGQLLGAIFSDWAQKLGAEEFTLIEVGAGEGRLAADLLSSYRRKPVSSALDPGFRRGDEPAYIAVEKSPVRRSFLESVSKKHSNLKIHADLSKLKNLSGVLFANELIDAFPVHRIQQKGGRLRELFVSGTGTQRRFVWKEPSTPQLEAYFKRLNVSLPDAYETEVNLGMRDWLTDAYDALEKGLVVFIDYGRPAWEYYAPERTRGTLRSFSKHKVSADFLDPAAMVDLTADVDFTSLALDAKTVGFTPLAFMEMGTFLMMGVHKITNATTGLKYLLHPEGLGTAFHVLVLGKGIDPKDWTFEHNRLSRLRL